MPIAQAKPFQPSAVESLIGNALVAAVVVGTCVIGVVTGCGCDVVRAERLGFVGMPLLLAAIKAETARCGVAPPQVASGVVVGVAYRGRC